MAGILLAIFVWTPTYSTIVQKRPSLAGQWSLRETIGPPVADLGKELTITESNESLSIVHVIAVPAGRGSIPGTTRQEKIGSIYRFNGMETNASTIAFGNASSETFDTSSWEDSRLIVLRKWRSSTGLVSTVQRRVLSIAADGTLIVETEGVKNGASSGVTRAFYQKVSKSPSRPTTSSRP